MSIIGALDDFTPQPWTEEAACASVGEDFWFPEKGESAYTAKKICFERCPVREECLAFALANCERHGIWGGYGEHERRSMERPSARPNLNTAFAEHGTEAGAARHWRRGEKACDSCREGARRAAREREMRKAQ